MTSRPAPQGQQLCLACGLCCTGVWFSHVNLEAREEREARAAGLNVSTVDGEMRSDQPCPLHRHGRCTGYERWRPAACDDFECKLLSDHLAGRLTLEQALGHVTAARAMAERIQAELGPVEGGLLGKRFLMRIDDSSSDSKPAALAASPATRLDAVALNRYYEKYFRRPTANSSR